MGKTAAQPQPIPKPLFLLGCILLAIATFFAVWGFHSGNLTESQCNILKFFCSLAGGFGASCFTGALAVQMNFGPRLTLSAGAGFGVWAVVFFNWSCSLPVPPRLSIENQQFLGASSLSMDRGRYALKQIEPITATEFMYKDATNLKLVIAFYVQGLQHPEGNVRLNINWEMYDNDNEGGKQNLKFVCQESAPEEVRFDDWRKRPNAQSLGISNILALHGLTEEKIQQRGIIPYFIVISELKQLPEHHAIIRLHAEDKLAGTVASFIDLDCELRHDADLGATAVTSPAVSNGMVEINGNSMPSDIPLDEISGYLSDRQWHDFSDDVKIKAYDNLPCSKVDELITVFYEPKGTTTNFLKIQCLKFKRDAHGPVAIRGRVAGGKDLGSDLPVLYVYHFGGKGVLRERTPYTTPKESYNFNIEPGDTITFIAKYGGTMVGGDYHGGWRDWHTVEVSDLAPLEGLWYGFYAGSANYNLHFAENWDFYAANNKIWFAHGKQSFSGQTREAQNFLAEKLSFILEKAAPDFETDGRFKGALPFLIKNRFQGVDWAVDEKSAQTRDTAYITERE